MWGGAVAGSDGKAGTSDYNIPEVTLVPRPVQEPYPPIYVA